MYPSVAQIVGFIFLVVVMSGVAIVLNRRIEKRRMAEQAARNAEWVRLDTRRDGEHEPPPSIESTASEQGDELTDESDGQGLPARAKQNGHFSESKRPS